VSTTAGWTGREARALRLAKRMSIRAFAARLGVTTATVSNWDQRGPLARLRTETQQLLDIDLAQAPAEVQDRFTALTLALDLSGPGVHGAKAGPGLVAGPAARYPPEPERGLLAQVTDLVACGGASPALRQRVHDLDPMLRPDPPRRIGTEDVTRIQATTSVFRDWDNRWGGGLSRTAVIAQLQWVAACATHSHFASMAVKNELLTALADLAGVAAFLCYDVKYHAQARALWLLGLSAASESQNIDLVGTILRQLTHQALHLDRPDEALGLVRLAYATTVRPAHHVPELALAEIAAYEGWCHAATGRVQPCHRALGRAQEHFDNTDGDPPPWLAHLDGPEVTALRGHSYHVLARHEPAVADRATELLQAAIAGRTGDYARSRTLNLIALCATYLHHGEHIDEGIAVGEQALEGVSTLTSPRTLDRLRALHPLTLRHLDTPGVPEFRDRLDQVLADA